MEEQDVSPRTSVEGLTTIYAYVGVSLLGALSKREDVDLVWALGEMDMLVPPSSPSRGFVGQGGEAVQPRLPITKGYPYPKMSNSLVQLVYQYERGELTAEEAAAGTRQYQGSSVRVYVPFYDETQLPVVVAWLKSKGVPDSALTVGVSSFLGYVPVPLLRELSRKPGVLEARPARRRAPGGGGPQSSSQQQPPPARPVPVTRLC